MLGLLDVSFIIKVDKDNNFIHYFKTIMKHFTAWFGSGALTASLLVSMVSPALAQSPKADTVGSVKAERMEKKADRKVERLERKIDRMEKKEAKSEAKELCRKQYREAVKSAEKTFRDSIKASESIFKSAVSAAQDAR